MPPLPPALRPAQASSDTMFGNWPFCRGRGILRNHANRTIARFFRQRELSSMTSTASLSTPTSGFGPEWWFDSNGAASQTPSAIN